MEREQETMGTGELVGKAAFFTGGGFGIDAEIACLNGSREPRVTKKAEMAARHAKNRMAQPSEIVEGALFLLCDRASFVSGTVHGMDGDYTVC